MLWRKNNSYVLLVGMYISTSIMENSLEIPQKAIKLELLYDSFIPVFGCYPKELKSV